MLSFMTLLAAAAAIPQPAELHTFQDWTVGCDNGLACEAIALLPEDGESQAWTTLSLRRGAGAGDRPVLVLDGIEARPATLLVDTHPLEARFGQSDEGYTILADDAALIEALRSGLELEVRGADEASLGRISMRGARAAMLYMDEQQRRLDSVTALVRTGTRPENAMPEPPSLPTVRRAPAPADQPLTLSAALVSNLRRENGCTIDEVGGPDDVETVQIETAKTLILLSCGSGAYNFSAVPLIAQRRGGRIITAVAPFDLQWGLQAEEGRPTLINASWDPEARLLREYSRGRGIGDCGTHSEYAWDGTSFRLVRQEAMGECRGSLDYITTWRADVR